MLRKIVTASGGRFRGCFTPESRVTRFVGWDDSGTLLVWYRDSGRVYVFHGVDAADARSCAQAESVGRYLHLKIRGRYPEARVA